jgi:hypothetical protein
MHGEHRSVRNLQLEREMMSDKAGKELIRAIANRRNFVKKLGLTGAAAGIAGGLAPRVIEAQSSFTDVDILNFALNLEYLEAEFYTIATTGGTIDQLGNNIMGAGTSGATTGGSQVTFTSSAVKAMAQELAADERTHVADLQTAITSLGGNPIAKPPINLGALGFGFGSQSDFLKLARIFEDLGVSAYAGAASLITSKTVLDSAARILAVEAEHSGTIRWIVATQGIASTPVDALDIVPPPSGTQYFSANASALAVERTPGQVLYIALGGKANATSGGFFPSGVNGLFNMASSSAATSTSATLTASPNPIPLNGAPYGVTTISWNAPGASYIQVRVGGPNGALFTTNFPTGSMATGAWVTDGELFFLQDISGGKPLTAANTLATLIVHTM